MTLRSAQARVHEFTDNNFCGKTIFVFPRVPRKVHNQNRLLLMLFLVVDACLANKARARVQHFLPVIYSFNFADVFGAPSCACFY
jgi:hypothetical protein